ncbi:hypothetical protein ACET3Z_026991 [Daucus carota]
MEYDATASAGSLQDGVCAEPIRARRMSSGEDSAAVAAALKKAKTATASGEEAEKEAVKERYTQVTRFMSLKEYIGPKSNVWSLKPSCQTAGKHAEAQLWSIIRET